MKNNKAADSVAEYYAECRKKWGEDNDCSVVALAEIANISYELARDFMKKAGRKKGRGVRIPQIFAAIKMAGCDYDSSPVRGAEIAKFLGRKKLTVSMIEKYGMFRDGVYLAFVANHVLAIKNGEVRDWSKGRGFHIKTVYKIKSKNT